MPDTFPGSSTPASRRRLTAHQRRIQVFAAAADVVAANGYANATLTEIASHAGIAKGLLWHYFTDRDDLLHQTLGHLAAVIRDAVVTGLDVTAPTPTVIRAVITRTALLTRTHPTELEAIDQIVHNLRSPDGRQTITTHDYQTTYAEHEQLLRRGQTENTIRPGDPHIMAVSYQGVIDAMIGYLQTHPTTNPHTYAAAVAELLLNGLANPTPQ